jgi:hypothetical protein
MKSLIAIATGILLSAVPDLRAADSDNAPRPTPLDRPTMKELLEDMKARKPRIPLPLLTDEEKAKVGERGGGYEARLRALYGPAGGDSRGVSGFGGGKENEPGMTLDYRFKVELFWIVSRTNNCQY